MSLLALLAAQAPVALTPVTATTPTWTDDIENGGGTWASPTITGLTYSPASGTATPGQMVTVTVTEQPGYDNNGPSSFTHTFPAEPQADTTPYAFPTARPWNVPHRAITPTGANGEAIHPGVVDFFAVHGLSQWNGYRYWMGMTPYENASAGVENPFILASHDGYTWVTPPGQVNPIDPPPGSTGYNSDPDVAYDPTTGRLWCIWREHNHSDTSRPIGTLIHSSWSTTGNIWNKIDQILVGPSGTGSLASPALVKIGPGQWRMTAPRAGDPAWTQQIAWWEAPDPAGPWTLGGLATEEWINGTYQEPWHWGMTYHNGIFYGLNDLGDNGGQHIVAGTSTDLTAWRFDATPLIASRPGMWDEKPYRACMQPHENGTHMRVWYSTLSGPSGFPMGTGYTQIPLSEWPAPPD